MNHRGVLWTACEVIFAAVAAVMAIAAVAALAACAEIAVPTPAQQTAVASSTASPPPVTPLALASPTGSTPAAAEVSVYLVALEDGGQNGIAVGCGDSLVAVNQTVDAAGEPVKAALEQLFSYKTQLIGDSGLYNALYQSDLRVEGVEVGPGGDANVALAGQVLLGGVCDAPRFQGQIEQTIRAASGASAVNVTINGRPLREMISGR